MTRNLPFAGHIAKYAFAFLKPAIPGGETTRQQLYSTLEGLYYNSIFERLGLAALDPELAANAATDSLRGIYNPATAIVDCYVDWCLHGVLGPEGGETEYDVHVDAPNAAVAPAVQRLWTWSNLETEKAMLPFYAANLGDALLSVVARPDAAGLPGKVWVEVRHPGIVQEVDYDDRGHIVYARLAETRTDARTVDDALRLSEGAVTLDNQPYQWSAVYTKTEFATFRDGKLHDYGTGSARFPNPWGFVPLVLVQHKRSGGDWGLNAYHSSISAINELCLDASVMGQLLGQWLAPQWAIFGVGRSQNKVNRDGSAWLFEEKGDAKPLVADVDFEGGYTHMKEVMRWLSDRQPELALSRAREANLETGAAIRAMLFETVKKLERAEDAYDQGLVRALQMGMTMAQTVNPGGRPLEGFEAIGTYESGALDFRFDRPEVLPVSELEKLQAETAKADLNRQRDLTAAVAPGTTAPADAGQTAASLLASRLLNGAGVEG